MDVKYLDLLQWITSEANSLRHFFSEFLLFLES